jgi:antitoxin component of MazEF toxin-antitoxin module|tara:strand:+ start:42 stop:215 length:174 start_codon:yes stop_codon:yes gene_type:complete
MTDKTTVVSVNKNSNCVRTVIPYWIAKLMDLEPGDKIVWTVSNMRNFTVKVEKDVSE